MAKRKPGNSAERSGNGAERSGNGANGNHTEGEPTNGDRIDGNRVDGERANGSEKPDFKSDVLVVGIGASAGGIQALSTFFANVGDDSGIAYVVILHLSPDHESQLAHVLQQVSKIPVTQVTQKTRVEANHVYVVPPDKSLTMEDNHIIVKPLKTVEERRAPVDIFFRTLAETHGPKAVGVVLSGTGANGSMGIKRIKEYGGAAFVQNPREAEFNEMPRNSIATELIDQIMPVAQIPEAIITYRNNRGLISIPDEPTERPEEQQNALREIFTQLRVRTGHDFSNYKRPTMLRRIERRISVKDLQDIGAYSTYIREHPDESSALLKDLLISVTNFFRDKKAFEALEKNIIPRLFQGRGRDKPVRVWVAGCATGEEAYSIAMIAAERTLGDIEGPSVQVFATDIDEQAIAIAREGLYSLNDAADVSPERLRRFFTKEGNEYRVRREVREMVLFAQHNLIKDPPFSHLDLVSCRNLLIYFNQTAQERAMETIHFALKPGGFLFIGSSESVDGSSDLFVPVDKENHIFQSRHVTARAFPVPESVPVYRSTLRLTSELSKRPGERERITYNDLHLRLVEEFAPPSVVINQDYEIVHVSDRAGKYMMVAGGEPTNNLMKLIRPEIRLELRTALFQATQQQSNVEVKNLRIKIGGHEETINLLVRPVTGDSDTASGFILVVFEQSVEEGDAHRAADYAAPEPVARQLEEELVRSRTQLQSALEQAEIQSEELRASNEELQAMNEELRSSAEELETSKEELQSINEELTTVNQELKVKIDELSHTNNNFTNLLNSIDIAVVFLDRSLRVNLFSPAASRIFNLIAGDIGRPLSDITSSLDYRELAADADNVLETLQTVEREVTSPDGRIFEMDVFPYRTGDDRINGVVLTFIDITQRKRAEIAVAEDLADTTILHNLAQRLILEDDIQVIYEDILDAAIKLASAHAGMVQVYHPDTARLEVIATRGFSNPTADHFRFLNAGSGTSYGLALKTGRRVLIDFDDPSADDADGSLKMHVEEGYRSGQSIPLVSRTGKPIGMVSTHWRTKYRPSERQQRFLDLLARQASDVIDQRHSDKALEFQGQLLNTVEQSVIATDLDGTVTYWNQFAARLFGWTAEEAIGRRVMELNVPESEFAKSAEIMESLRKGQTWSGDFMLRRKDGSIFPAHVFDTPITDAKGELIGIVGVSIDITERRKTEAALRASEERLRLLMDSFTDVALFTTDTDSVVTAWNPGAEKIFGFKADEMIGKQTADVVFTAEDRAKGEPDKERRLAVKDGKALDERWHLRKNGERFFASGFMVPLTDGERLVGFGKIASDLTERKQFEQQLDDARKGLEKRVGERTQELAESNESLRREVRERVQAERERIELLRRIVTTQEDERRRIARDLHDHLGQQMTSMRLQLQSILEMCDDGEICDKVEGVQRQAEQLDRGVDFLAWELRPAALDDLGLRTTLANFVKEWSSYTGIPAEFHATGLGRTRLAFETETNLYRIAQEALNNVQKHSKAKNVSVLLEKRGVKVTLIIEDDGVGFDLKNKKSVRKGLGLEGMKERSAIIGGTLEIESGPDKGTTVFAKVPATLEDKV